MLARRRMEPTGAERHGREAGKSERAGAYESNALQEIKKSFPIPPVQALSRRGQLK